MNSGNQHIKSFNADPRAKNRIKFISAKQRAKQASADVYRSYKRRTGVVTSAASREERVHHRDQFNDSAKSHKKRKTITSGGGETTAIIGNNDLFHDEEGEELELETSTTFQMELDLARDRNASNLFAKLYPDLVPLVRSLPEILHHAEKILSILMSYVLSPYSSPHEATPEKMWKSSSSGKNRELFVVNIVTTDVLHLLSVLARDLRHEIHPYVHEYILPRIINDLINPPTTILDPEMKQQRTLDITVVETAFRTLSYIFRYDTSSFLREDVLNLKKKTQKEVDVNGEGCLELMRKYYGSTLAHKSDFVRRLGAESFSPLVRKLKSTTSKKKHVRRVIRSLATSAAASVSFVSEPPVGHTKDYYEPSIVMDSRQERARGDAIDGVALLLFYVVRGVPGRLHSKSSGTLKIIFSNILPMEKEDSTTDWNTECFKKKVTSDLISLVLTKIRGHIKNGANFLPVWDELYDCLNTVVKAIKKGETGFFTSFGFLVQLIVQSVSYRNGALLKAQDGATADFEKAEANRISLMLQAIVEPKFYSRLGEQNQVHVLKLLCVAWKVFPDHPALGHRLSCFIPTIAEGKNITVDPMLVLAKELLPFLSKQLAAEYLVPRILKAIAKRSSGKGSDGMMLVLHAVATSRLGKGVDVEDNDDLFSAGLAPKCFVTMIEKETLLDACLKGFVQSEADMDKDGFVRMGYTARIIPFVALLGCDGSVKESFTFVEKISKQIVKALKRLDKAHFDSRLHPDAIVVKALLIESLAFAVSGAVDTMTNTSAMKKIVTQASEFASKQLFLFPTSLLAVKSAAEMAIVMRRLELDFNSRPNKTFDSLTSNLKASNHFLRLHTLRLLNTFPQRPFVTNFDDIDLSGDLDEKDYQQKGMRPTPNQGASSLSGMCDILETMLQIETTQIGLDNERKLTGAINRVEMLGRTGKLPALYAEAAVNYMFGVMNIKFQPLWTPAVRSIAALSTAHELTVWPSMAAQLKLVMDPDFFFARTINATSTVSAEEENTEDRDMYHDHRLLTNWDKTSGEDASIFQEQIDASKTCGRVSRHQSTDRITIFEQVWSVLESVPQLTTKKSRVIVPIFLSFLHNQYFLFHNDDPDAREFNLGDHIEGGTMKNDRTPWSRDKLGRKMLQKKVVAFLKMFAEVKGMQQLYKHKLLQVIFVSFLSNPDTLIVQLSLHCIIGFKLPYVTPHVQELKGILSKHQMREILTKFNLSRENGDVDNEHRIGLFPIVIRILFGRLSARGSGGKSSKDSPAVRRAAILSFLSGLDASEGELDYFVYMMIRSFIPKNVNMNVSDIGHGSNTHIRDMIAHVQEHTSVEQVASVPSQRQEGLLNLLSEVVKKLGFDISEFVPTFVKLILGILECSESFRKNSNVAPIDSEDGDVEINNDYEQQLENGANRSGKIRSMCFLRLSDLMSQFSETTDFLVFGPTLWSVVGPALKNLPNSTVNASNAPSLLILLEKISSHPRLISLLAQDESSVSAVFQCISECSKINVVDCALRFVDNLLTEGGLYDPNEEMSEANDRVGMELVRNQIDLLIIQFTRRLKSTDESSKSSQLASRELSILCRVTKFLVSDESTDERKTETLATLCGLLLPFLNFGRRINERTQLDVLRILSSLLPQIGQDAAFSHLQSFSRLLGPNKSGPGIKSLEIRQQIVKCIGAIAENEGKLSPSLKKVVEEMQDLNASNPKRLEWDFERVLPVLNGLGGACSGGRSWFSYTKSVDTSQHGLKILTPLMYCCLHLLHDTDGVLSRGAFKALNTLIVVASEQQESDISWQRLIETSLMACIRIGLKTHSLAVRRSFILLLSTVAKCFSTVNSPNLCSDLSTLVRDDEPELDFFLNITHVQIHRRARALGRLRKCLSGFDGMNECTISTQSLTNILLPLALHPIYECDKIGEEAYAMEAIATVSAITKLLPWGKYQSTLWTALMQVSRHESQERFIVSMICGILDSFHFDVYVPETTHPNQFESPDEGGGHGNGARKDFIWNQLNKKLIPTIESFLMKDTIERDGTKNKSLRSPIVLALTKLFLKLPVHVFQLKFPRLLTVICQALKNGDSDLRDIARTTLARVATVVDIKYLSDIVRELAVSLNDGYKLHVRTAALHSVLYSISKSYKRPVDASQLTLPFDMCVPAMMDILQQDIFGTASEMKEVETSKKRLVKEAGGMKGLGSLELIGRMILFQPSIVASSPSNHSSVHALVTPFLSRLHDPEVPSSIIGKVKEAMNRIIIGITQNTSASSEEVLPFAYATVSPFIFVEAEDPGDDEDLDDSDDEDLKDLEVSKTQSSQRKNNSKEHNKTVRKVFDWAPSQLKNAKDSASAYEMKIKNKLELRQVQDGANAPKLTGSRRYDSLKSKGKDLNSPATSCAVSLGLGLLHSHLKKYRSSCNERMSDPFVRILFQCVKYSKDNTAVLLSLKCLHVLLRLDLPSVPKYRSELAKCILKILSSMSCNTQNEMVQSGFKTLTLLLGANRGKAIEYLENTDNINVGGRGKKELNEFENDAILNKGQMSVLVSILQSALTDAEHHNATFGVIKTITSRQFISPEYYDLMETILKMTVQSQKPTMRQQAAKIFMQYLIEYPMGKQRLEKHLKQLVLNIKYEYEDGRISALDLVKAAINKLPLPLLEEYTQLLFLPLVLQLVNDESKKCRERVGECITLLLSRLSTQVLQSLYNYAERWSNDESGVQLTRTAVQLFGLFVDARVDFVKKGSRLETLVSYLSKTLDAEIANIDHTSVLLAQEWEMIYFCLQAFEKIGNTLKPYLWKDLTTWDSIIKCLSHPHPWVQLMASRIINSHFSSCEPTQFEKVSDNAASVLLKIPGSLFEITRNLCFEINSEEEHQSDGITTMAIKNLSWIIKIMDKHPSLCFKIKASKLVDDGSDDDDNHGKTNSPVTWLITRLSNIAKKRGAKRREAVFKCFAAFATVCETSIMCNHLELMIGPLHRVIVEAEAREETTTFMTNHRNSTISTQVSDLPKEVLQLLEDKCGTDIFINTLAAVKSKAREKRDTRKQRIAQEAVLDPENAAKRRIAKQQHEKSRKKRRIHERKVGRGALTKKPRHHS